MISKTLLRSTAALLVDENESIRQQTLSNCLSFRDETRVSLIEEIIDVLISNFENKPQLTCFLVSSLQKMNESEKFTNEMKNNLTNKISNILLNDLFKNYDFVMNDSLSNLFKSFKDEKGESDLDLILQLFKTSTNNFFVIKLLSESVRIKSNDKARKILEDSFGSILDSFLSLVKNEINDIHFLGNVAASLNSTFISIIEIEDDKKSQYKNQISLILKEIIPNYLIKCVGNDEACIELRNNVFNTITSSIDFFDDEDEIFPLIFGSQNSDFSVVEYLLNSIGSEKENDKSAVSAVILLGTFLQKFSDSEIISNLTEKVAKSLLIFTNGNFPLICGADRKTELLLKKVVLNCVKFKSNSIIEPSLTSLKNIDKFQSGLLFLNFILEDGQISVQSEKGKLICQCLNEICNNKKLPKTVEIRVELFKLWSLLVHYRLATSSDDVKTASIFRAVSAPFMDVAEGIGKCNEILSKVITSDTKINIPSLLDSAIDPHFVVAAPVAFAALALSDSDPIFTSEINVIVPRCLIYLSSPYFTAKMRSDVMTVLGRICRLNSDVGEGEFNFVKSAKLIAERGKCYSFSQKIVNKFVLALIENAKSSSSTGGSQVASIWAANAILFTDHFPTESHPECTKETMFPISNIRSGAYNVIALLYSTIKSTPSTPISTTTSTTSTASARTNANSAGSGSSSGGAQSLNNVFQPMLAKFDMANVYEGQAMAAALKTIYSYNTHFALDSFRSKTDSRKFAGTSDNARVFALEFMSRCLDADARFEARVMEMLLADDGVSSATRSHALRRLCKKTKSSASLNMQKVNSLLGSFLKGENLEGRNNEITTTIKASLSLTLTIVKRKQKETSSSTTSNSSNFIISNDILKRVVVIHSKFPEFRYITKELFELTPIDLNFFNFVEYISVTNSVEIASLISNLISNMNTNPTILKTPQTAASVSMMFLSEKFRSQAKSIGEKVFSFTKDSPEEFPLTYYCSSSEKESGLFVDTLVSCLASSCSDSLWNSCALSSLLVLAKDPRFTKVLQRVTDSFIEDLSKIDSGSFYGSLLLRNETILKNWTSFAKILIEKDRANFVNKIITSRLLNEALLSIVPNVIDEIGQAIFANAMKAKTEQLLLYSNIFKIVQLSRLPENIQLAAIVFIIRTISQILSLSIEARDKNALFLFEEGVKSLNVLGSRFTLIKSPRVSKSLQNAKRDLFPSLVASQQQQQNQNQNQDQNDINAKEDIEISQFNFLRILFSVCSNDIQMFHIQNLAEFSPLGALAGYAEIIHQGRPLINEILQLGKTENTSGSNKLSMKKPALLAIMGLKQLPVDRYGESQLIQMFDFVLDSLLEEPMEAFNCVLTLYEWLPKNVVFEKCGKMFDNTQKAIRNSPSIYGFNCLTLFSESLTFSNRPELKQHLPMFLTLAYCYCDSQNLRLSQSARKALLTMCQFSGMSKTSQKILKNYSVYYCNHIIDQKQNKNKNQSETENTYQFLKEISSDFVGEMDLRCIDSAYIIVEGKFAEAKVGVCYLLCSAMHNKRGVERNVHLRLAPILNSKDEEVKIELLRAIRAFPPILD